MASQSAHIYFHVRDFASVYVSALYCLKIPILSFHSDLFSPFGPRLLLPLRLNGKWTVNARFFGLFDV